MNPFKCPDCEEMVHDYSGDGDVYQPDPYNCPSCNGWFKRGGIGVLMALEGYCRNGTHYIGDANECWRCDLWEQQNAKARTYHGAVKANRLKTTLKSKRH